MRRRTVTLSEEQEQELRHCRDHHRLPYMRLKAAAILKVATGQTIKQVELTGLHKRRRSSAGRVLSLAAAL